MKNRSADISQHKAARVAGLAYLLIIVTSILAMMFGPFQLIVQGNNAATFNNIVANELIFRLGTAYDLIMFASVMILAIALFVTLKPVGKNLALLAMSWRMGEAILGCLSVLSSLIVLVLINGKSYSAEFDSGQLQALVGLFLNVQSAAISIVFVFLSLGSIVFCYLFFKSRYIPRLLAAFGIFSFLLMLFGTIASILFPNSKDMIQIVSSPLAIIFELAIGYWLLFKGIDVDQWENQAL